jgi:hypothetical protein
VKGNCTTIILKDLKIILYSLNKKDRATLGIEPVLADNETAVLPLHYIAWYTIFEISYEQRDLNS